MKRWSPLRYGLTESARVDIRVERVGAHSAGYVPGMLQAEGRRGRNQLKLAARVGRRKLGLGRYRITAVAVDAAGNRSAPRRLTFRVVR